MFQMLFLLVCISLPSPIKGGDIRGRTRYRSLDSRRMGGGEGVGSEGLLGGEATGSKRRARVPIIKDRRGSQITRGEERKDLSNGGRTKQSKRIKLTTENTLLKKQIMEIKVILEWISIKRLRKRRQIYIYWARQ